MGFIATFIAWCGVIQWALSGCPVESQDVQMKEIQLNYQTDMERIRQHDEMIMWQRMDEKDRANVMASAQFAQAAANIQMNQQNNLAATERMYANQQFLYAQLKQESANRIVIIVGIFVVIMVIILLIGLIIKSRFDSGPRYLPQPNIRFLPQDQLEYFIEKSNHTNDWRS